MKLLTEVSFLNVRDFETKSGDVHYSRAKERGRVVVPAGIYPIQLRSNVELHLEDIVIERFTSQTIWGAHLQDDSKRSVS